MKITKSKLPTRVAIDDGLVQLNGKYSKDLLCFRFELEAWGCF